MAAKMSTANFSYLPRPVNSSSPARRPVLAMRMWICYHSFGCTSNPDPIVIDSWIAGALGSAWRAIDQYLDLNDDQLPGVREEFWKKWGRTEYLDEDKLWEKRDEDKPSEKRGGTEYSDEVSDDGSVGWGQELMERHHVIALYKSGVAV